MRFYRKLLCRLLVCIFMLQMIPFPAFAEEISEEVPTEELFEEEVFEEEILEEETLTEEIIVEEIFEEELPAEEIFEEELPEEVPSEEEAEEIPFLPVFDTVPLYFQTDFPDTAYGEGTVATSGCSVTCLAMVASWLTGHEYLPDELARYCSLYGENNMQRLEYCSDLLQLPYEKNWDWRITLQALQEGKPVIVLVDSNTAFTHSQHFILLTGLTEEGKILVNDPYAPNYDHWALQQGFAWGFEGWEIVSGFQGAWVYDPDAMPEEPYIYYEEPVQVEDYGPVPLYFQNDYPDVRYAGRTVATSGCSVTSLAMVASWMTGHEYLPEELARYFGGRAENHMTRIELGSDTLQIPYEKNTNWHTTLQALREGKIAIVLVNSNTHFTQSQHFLVLTGLTPDGKVLVNDSWKPNYSHWALTEGFTGGFDPNAIMCGFEGAWVYDKSVMAEDPFIYYEPEPERLESRYAGLELTPEEEYLLAKVVWAEARGECAEGQQAVAEVVLNRLYSEAFPNSLTDVIYGADQFRSVPYLEEAEPYQAQYDAIEAALYGPNILPMDVYYFATWATNDHVWGQIENHIFCYAD